MCSVSFLPNSEGFDLLMNRDEQLTRPSALPPVLHRCGERKAMFPHELNGGTWVGVNDAGLALALINWYSQPQRAGTLSRGGVIPALLAANTGGEAESLLRELPHPRMNPFRLVVISLEEKYLKEWRSNAGLLDVSAMPWEKCHWFSSGFNEEIANQVRSLTCRCAEEESDWDSLPWLRRLHRSHLPEKGPFSLCMHREDACSVSFTEVSVNRNGAEMSYHAGPPCEGAPQFARSLLVSEKNHTATD